MTIPTKARLTLISEAAALFEITPERAAAFIDSYFVLLADAVRAGVQPEKPVQPAALSDEDRRAALIRRMDDQKRSVEDG